MDTPKPILDKSDAEEAARFKWLLDHPDAGRHFLRLLEEHRTNKRDDFRRMVDRMRKANIKPLEGLE